MKIVQFNGRNYGRIMDFTNGKAYVSAKPGSEVRLLLKTLDGPIDINVGEYVVQKDIDTYCKATYRELLDESL